MKKAVAEMQSCVIDSNLSPCVFPVSISYLRLFLPSASLSIKLEGGILSSILWLPEKKCASGELKRYKYIAYPLFSVR
jgi:hypothetical protein